MAKTFDPGEPGVSAGNRERILYLVGGFQLGGTERHLSLLLPRLDQTRWEPRVRLLGEDGPFSAPLREAGIDYQSIRTSAVLPVPKLRGMARMVKLLRNVVREIGSLKPSLIHCFLPEPCILGWLGKRITRVGSPLVMSRRSQGIRPQGFSGEKWLERRALLGADYVLGHSSAVVDEIRTLGVAGRRLRLIRNGVDLRSFDGAISRAQVRADQHWPDELFVVVCVANLIPYKEHSTLFRALAALEDNHPPWRLVLVGAGEPSYEAHLKDLACELAIADRIEFKGSCATIELLAGCDVGVLASRHEGFSNALIEYMAVGLPVVATDVGGNRDAVTNGHNGLLVPAGECRALSEALSRLMREPKFRDALAAAGYERAREEFSIERCVTAYEQFYASVLNGAYGR